MGETDVDEPGGRQVTDVADALPMRSRLGKRRGRIIAAVLTATLLVLLIAVPMLYDRPTVKIGVLVPLTGSASYLVDVRDGALIAAEEINKWGGVNGVEIELLIRDTESDPAKAVEVFQELERDEKPIFYMSTMSPMTVPLVPLAEENEVVLVGVVTSVQNLTEGMDWTVRYYSDAQDEVDATMNTLGELGVSDLVVLYGTDEFSISAHDIILEQCAASGCSVESHQVSQTDAEIEAAVSLVMGREAVFLSMTANLIRDTLICLRENDYSGHILTPSGGTSDVVKTLPEAEGIYVAAPAMYNENYLPAKWLAEKYESRYGRPLTHYASCGYDVLYLFSGLMRDVEMTRQNVHAVLESGFIFSGTTGPLQVDPGSHDIGFELLSAQITEGRLRYL